MNVLRQSGPAKQQKNDLRNKGDILLDAILRSSKLNELKGKTTYNAYKICEKASAGVFLERNKRKCVHKSCLSQSSSALCERKLCDKICCDNKKKDSSSNINSISDTSRVSENDIYINCDNVKRKKTEYKMRDISNVFSLEYLEKRQKVKVKQKITFDDDGYECNNNNKETSCNESAEMKDEKPKSHSLPTGIPSASDQAKFRKNLDSAASMVFHSRTGLPLTSSPAPVRRGKSCFDFDSSINSVSAIRRYVFILYFHYICLMRTFFSVHYFRWRLVVLLTMTAKVTAVSFLRAVPMQRII